MSGSLLLRAGAHGSGGAAPRAAREGVAASVSLLPERGRIVWSGLSNVGQAVKDKQRASGGERATSRGEVKGRTPNIYHYRFSILVCSQSGNSIDNSDSTHMYAMINLFINATTFFFLSVIRYIVYYKSDNFIIEHYYRINLQCQLLVNRQ